MLFANVGVGQILTSSAVANTICSGDNLNIRMTYNQKIYFFLEYNLNDGTGWVVYNTLPYNSPISNPSIRDINGISLPTIVSASSIDFRIRYSVGGSSYNAGAASTSGILLTITDNPLPNATVAVPSTICNGTPVSLGGTAVSGSTYSWTSSAGSYASTSSNPIVSPSISQTYSLTETITTTGCTNSNSVLINVNARPTATITNTNTTICEGANEIVYVNVTAVGNWTLTVNDGGSVNGVGSGVQPFIRSPNITKNYFIVSAVDANCSSNLSDLSGTWTITVNPTPSVAAITPQIKCNTISSDIINFSGTVTGTTYAWTNSQSSIGIAANGSGTISSTTLTNSTNSPVVGIFTVTPTANSCPGPSGTFSITVNPTPTVAAITPQIKCNTISSDLINFSGTITGTTYAWTNSQSSIGIAASGSGTITSTTLTNSTTSPIVGSFIVTPTANSCPGPSGTFSITVNPTPTVAAITPQIKCNTTSSDIINFSGTVTGTTYAWINSQSSIGIAASGSGSITSTILTNSTSSPVVGSFIVTPTANSCTGPTGTFTITVNPLPTKPTLTSSTICEGQSTTVSMTLPSGTYTYTWQVPIGVATSTTKTVSTSKAGTYSLTITDVNSCTSEVGTGTVTVNPLPTKPTLTSSTICEGATATITGPTGVYTYTWQVPTGVASSTTKTISTSKAGTYSLTITDANSCTSEVGTGTVTVNPTPTKPTLTSSTICEGQSTSVSMTLPTGTYTYTWQVPTGVVSSTTKTISTSKAGTYSLTITDVNSCTSEIGTGTVTVNSLPAKPTLTSPIICEGLTANVTMLTPTGTSTYTYTWTVPTGVATSTTKTISTSKAGTYSLTITDANSCTSEAGTATVTVNPLPTKPTLTSPTICEGETASVIMSTPTGTATYTYTWTVPTGVATSTTNSVSATKAGAYSLTITDANSCTSEVGTGIVTVKALPVVTITNPSAVCAPGTVDLTATAITAGSTASLTYTYFTNATATSTLTNTTLVSTSGTYYIKGTSILNCSAIKPVNATINPLPSFNLLSPSVCSGSPLLITANPLTGLTSDYNFTWLVPAGVNNPGNVSSFTTTIPGIYTASIKNKSTNCESGAINNSITFYPLPTAAAIVASDNKVMEGATLNLIAAASGGTGAYLYTWIPNATINYTISGGANALFNALKEGIVNIKYQVKDANNCLTQSANFEITIAPATIIFDIPNAFTPNGDGLNDKLKIISNAGISALTSFKIFSRSGNLVFESRDLSIGWDGRFNGNMLPTDVYYWTASYVDRNNQTNSKTGTVLLLK